MSKYGKKVLDKKNSYYYLKIAVFPILLLACNMPNNKNTDLIEINLILIKAQHFMMGSDSAEIKFALHLCELCETTAEEPMHKVKLNAYKIGKYEITNNEFCTFMNEYGSDRIKEGLYKGEIIVYDCSYEKNYWGIITENGVWKPVIGYENHPIVFVTWYGATEYCNWLSNKTGKKYRLPTEAEWECAAKANENYHFAGSNTIDEVAWYDNQNPEPLIDGTTHKVGLKKANGYGIYDMSGNVWEWCSDWFGEYDIAFSENPIGPTSGEFKIIRGGGWYGNARRNRINMRAVSLPNSADSKCGFRIVEEI